MAHRETSLRTDATMRQEIFAIVLAAHVLAMLLLCFAPRWPRTVVSEPTMMAAIILEERKAEVAEETRRGIQPPPLRTIPVEPEEILRPRVNLDDLSSPQSGGSSSAITACATSAHEAAEEIARRGASPAFRRPG
jgi:hypothetical protein